MGGALILARALGNPASVGRLDHDGWTSLLAVARAELLLGTLAHRVGGLPVPPAVEPILVDARAAAAEQRRAALWEAEMVRRALRALGCPVILLKGTAYAAAGLAAGQGRSIGDCDILVPREALPAVEAALLVAGWEWVKPDPYDDAYYRRWMHELPPLIHRARDRMVDVHHTILPLTARPTPDARELITGRVELGNGLSVLSAEDMVVHAAAHLLSDGDMAGGMRNLWDLRCLLQDADPATLDARAAHHGLAGEVARARRLVGAVYGEMPARGSDAVYVRRLLARDGWGRPTRRITRFGFYVRSHALRMPPAMLARHLWIKWRRGA